MNASSGPTNEHRLRAVPAVASPHPRPDGRVGRAASRRALFCALPLLLMGCSFSARSAVAPLPEASCGAAADCQRQYPDIGACRDAVCEDGQCRIRERPDATPCGAPLCAGLSWQGAAVCAGGVCAAPAPVACTVPPGWSCTIAACEPAAGCTTTVAVDGLACDADGSACTPDDHCMDGACVAGSPRACEDGNPCTTDSCDIQTADCLHAAVAGPCDDGNACTVADACSGIVCSGKTVNCNDGDPCTIDGCDLALGCSHIAQAGCAAGPPPCIAGPESCDDGNPCSTDACDPQAGCVHTANSAPCDDGSACSSGDVCQGLVCSGTAVSCADGNPCTDDSCLAASGCNHTPNTAACNDGDACTQGENCQAGACKGGAGTPCDDGNPCTVDSCQNGGCVAEAGPYGIPCDDGNPCTADGGCELGACVQFADGACNDGQPCTVDTCDAILGCIHTPKSGCTLCAGKPTCIGAALPAFTLIDQNPSSPTWQQAVTPLAWKGKPILMIAVHGY